MSHINKTGILKVKRHSHNFWRWNWLAGVDAGGRCSHLFFKHLDWRLGDALDLAWQNQMGAVNELC